MILVDTCVWADHIRRPEPGLNDLLEEGVLLIHPFVIEELACGNLPERSEFLGLLRMLPRAPVAGHDEVLALIEMERLYGTGVGAVDAHLLASARLSHARIWSRDQAVVRAAQRLDLVAD